MKAGKAFEIFVKSILLSIGFSEVRSDGTYIFDAGPGQMINGLGAAHNADVLLNPPVQTPFYTPSRLLIECKDYTVKVGLPTIRNVLGLREDVNHFELVDLDEIEARRSTRRTALTHNYTRYYYQVAVASMSGYTIPAQQFAATHHIPLIEFFEMPFWERFARLIQSIPRRTMSDDEEKWYTDKIEELGTSIGQRTAIAITNTGQLLFLYNVQKPECDFADFYSLTWENTSSLWELRSGDNNYVFQLPKDIAKVWLNNANNDIELLKSALNCKAEFLSNMIVYYSEYGIPKIKMISIDKYQLLDAMEKLQ